MDVASSLAFSPHPIEAYYRNVGHLGEVVIVMATTSS